MTLTVGSLFSGIGGLELGLERAGMRTIWQVEKDDHCNDVLAKHWPHVERHRDIRALDAAALVRPDVVCGGFPCQPHSLAGARKASEDDRDLWPEFVRVLRDARPIWVVAENVRGLLSSEEGAFFGRVLRDLADLGFDASWQSIPAAAFGAPHRRWRVFVVAHTPCRRFSWWPEHDGQPEAGQQRPGGLDAVRLGEDARGTWAAESRPPGVAHGVPRRMVRLRAVGNAVMPHKAEYIGRRIIEAESRHRAELTAAG